MEGGFFVLFHLLFFFLVRSSALSRHVPSIVPLTDASGALLYLSEAQDSSVYWKRSLVDSCRVIWAPWPS